MIRPPKGITARLRASKRRRQQVEAKPVYALVDVRDGFRCRACGDYAGVSVHRHHLVGRSSTTLATVCHLCPDCHGFLHVRVGGKLLKISGDADQRNAHGALCGLTVETRNNDGSWRTEAGY